MSPPATALPFHVRVVREELKRKGFVKSLVVKGKMRNNGRQTLDFRRG